MKLSNGTKVCRRIFKDIPGLGKQWVDAVGELKQGFRLIVWGESGNGKSNLVMQLAAQMIESLGTGIYLSLEEKQGPTMQRLIERYIAIDKRDRLKIPDKHPSYKDLMEYLKKPRTPNWIIIDSVQYFDFDSERRYKAMEEAFPNKCFIFVSHAKGKQPDGRVADKIRYDAGVKIFVRKDIGFVMHSRYGGHTNYVIWEQGAKASRSVKEYQEDLYRIKPQNKKRKTRPLPPEGGTEAPPEDSL
jgi:energy-coupling factor transporter ATP-binding protein EcfA2